MPHYIFGSIDKQTCIGNTLSTFNYNFSSLDTNLETLSSYTVNSVNFLSSTMISVSSTLDAQTDYVSATLVSVSANLWNQTNAASSSLYNTIGTVSGNLQTTIEYVSSNVISDYTAQGIIWCPNEGGTINWDFPTVGNSAKVDLTATVGLANPTGAVAGQTGNIIFKLGNTAGVTISSFGNQWVFVENLSSFETSISAKNVVSYYYDGEHFLSTIVSFAF